MREYKDYEILISVPRRKTRLTRTEIEHAIFKAGWQMLSIGQDSQATTKRRSISWGCQCLRQNQTVGIVWRGLKPCLRANLNWRWLVTATLRLRPSSKLVLF